MNDNFDLRKYLIENKATTNSKIMKENEEVPFSSNDLKKVVIAGTTYEVGSDDPMDEGIIISIEKRKKGYFIIGQSGQEGYGYGIDFEGKEVEEEDLEDTGMTETKKKHSKMMNENEKPDSISMRLFLEGLGQDPDDPMFAEAIQSGDVEEVITLLIDTVGDGDEYNPFDGIYTQSDFKQAAINAQFSEEMIDDILNVGVIRTLEKG